LGVFFFFWGGEKRGGGVVGEGFCGCGGWGGGWVGFCWGFLPKKEMACENITIIFERGGEPRRSGRREGTRIKEQNNPERDPEQPVKAGGDLLAKEVTKNFSGGGGKGKPEVSPALAGKEPKGSLWKDLLCVRGEKDGTIERSLKAGDVLRW